MLAELLTDLPDQLSAPAGVYLVRRGAPAPAAEAERVAVEDKWMPTGKNAGRVVVKLAGYDSISAAETLAGAKLMIPAAERPQLEEDTFYIADLVGCALFNDGDLAGHVVDVEFAMSPDGRTRIADAPPLLCVEMPGSASEAEPSLVPFVRAHLQRIDLGARQIYMHLPEGLLAAGAEQPLQIELPDAL